MAHIHEKIDFTVAIFVVHDARVLLILHRKLGKWLPLGGHIELDEDPEIAALREAKEESGLDVELIGERPPTTEPGGTSRVTTELAATTASGPMVTPGMTMAWWPMKTLSRMSILPTRSISPP